MWRILTGLRAMPAPEARSNGNYHCSPRRAPGLGSCSGRGAVLQRDIVSPIDRRGSRQNQRTDIYSVGVPAFCKRGGRGWASRWLVSAYLTRKEQIPD